MDKMNGEYVFPKPFSDEVWRMIIFNNPNPPMVCVSLKKMEQRKIDDLKQSLEDKDWKNSSVLLSELKTAERFIDLCKGFIKE